MMPSRSISDGTCALFITPDTYGNARTPASLERSPASPKYVGTTAPGSGL